MDLSQCFAHSHPEKPREQWQLLLTHLSNAAHKAASFASNFQSEEWAWNAAWLHDLGKAAESFQAYLLQENGLDDVGYDSLEKGKINHSSAGAAYAENLRPGPVGRTLAYVAAGHHAGLTDYQPNNAGNGALIKRIEEGKQQLPCINAAVSEIRKALKDLHKPPVFIKQEGYHLWVRMLFSCLVDADFLDTEAFMQPEKAAIRGAERSLLQLKHLFDAYIQKLQRQAAQTPVNAIRDEILAASRLSALESPGLFTMTVPTGGGKTLATMAFAMDHAAAHGKERIIYVIPYTSIIEQTASIFAGIFGQENVIEHHSNLDPDQETQRSRISSENWNAPIIVTTNVQFFESLFADRPSRCRKLHSIVNSIVILDEAHLLPPKWLDPCVHAINELVANYKVTLVLSTATQPALPGLAAPHEIVLNPARLYEDLKRTKIHMPANLTETNSWESLASQLMAHDQMLCIVNTRRDCYDLFRLMPQGTIHLSALMCGAHRSTVIAEIKRRLAARDPIRVISTQLVEAGVDIDFPVIYRALAGLDSIAQAAGRCNREGRLESLGDVHVFVPPKDPPRGMLLKGANTTRELAMPDFDPQRPEAYALYFEIFYSKLNDTGRKWLQERLIKDAPMEVQFRTAAQEFELIEDQAQRAVIVQYGESNKWMEKLRSIGPTRDIMRRLQRYTVNVPLSMAERMIQDGWLEILSSGIIVQCFPNVYDMTVGLDVFPGQTPSESLIL